jgi:hypothetical protein
MLDTHATITRTAAIGRSLADRLTVTNEDGTVDRCTVAEFLAANHEADVLADVLALAPGESATLGGGAGPLLYVRREGRR